MPSVLTVGLPELPASTGDPVAALPESLLDGPGWLAALDEALRAGPVVLVCPDRLADRVEHAASVARQALETALVMVAPRGGGPLAGACAAGVLAGLLSEGALEPGAAVPVLDQLAGDAVDLAVLDSVADLDVQGLSLGQHLSSYLPGRRPFVVQVAPATAVARLTRGDDDWQGVERPVLPALRAAEPAEGGASAWRAVAMGDRALPVPLGRWLVDSGTDLPEVQTGAGEVAAWWGDARALELVLVPADVPAWLAALPDRRALEVCDWCRQPIDVTEGRGCPFCRQLPTVARRGPR